MDRFKHQDHLWGQAPPWAMALRHHLSHIEEIMAAIDDNIKALQDDVAADTAVVSSAVTLINGIAQQIKDAVAAALAAGATPAQLQALTDLQTAMVANTTSLSAAVAANTPAASRRAP